MAFTVRGFLFVLFQFKTARPLGRAFSEKRGQCANLDKISAVSGIPGHFEKCLPLGRLLGLRLRLIAPAAVGVRGKTGGHQIVFQKKRIRKGWLWSGETETLRSRGSSSFHSRHNRRRALRHIRQSRSCHRREQSFAHSGVRHALLPPAVDGSSAPCGAELFFCAMPMATSRRRAADHHAAGADDDGGLYARQGGSMRWRLSMSKQH
jgi:hypothetical protein